jgi:general secretion pathway protein F
MSAFEYQALDTKGRNRKGVMEADSARQVRQKLRDQGLTPLHVEEATRRAQRPRGQRISAMDLALFTRQLATLLRSGLPLAEALDAIARQSEKVRIHNLIMTVRSRVLEGRSLADSLGDFPAAFPDLYRATVAAGEQSGRIDLILERLAEYTENRRYLQQKTLLALFYPLLLSLVALFVVIGLLAYVVPQVVQVFHNMQQDLPLLTRFMIGLSDFIRDWGLSMIVLIFASLVLLRYALRTPTTHTAWHRLRLRIPLIGRLEKAFNIARFTRTLSILLASGVPVVEALHVTAQVLSNRIMCAAVMDAARQVREGTPLHTALHIDGLFPPLTLHLIASGEASGNLADMLERAAITQERDLEAMIATLLGLFEPILILLMGAIVLSIVLAILMPVFELNQLVGRP